MEALVKFLILLLLISFATRGECQGCTKDMIEIGTGGTGNDIGGMPIWNVTVTNHCRCPQKEVRLHCDGFQTVTALDPAILQRDGDACLLLRGGIFKPNASVSFTYAWDTPYVFWPASTNTGGCESDCSANKLAIGTGGTGRQSGDKTIWMVTITNYCNCSQSHIKLHCKGFQTAVNLDPAILKLQGDTCLLVNGGSISPSASVSFTYAWDPPYVFWPVESVIEPTCAVPLQHHYD